MVLASPVSLHLRAYEKFHNGEMTDYIPTDEELQASFDQLPQVN